MANWMEVLLLAATVGLVAAAPSPSPPPATPVVYYVLGTSDTNDCGDNIVLTSIAACQEAAAQLGHNFMDSWNDASFPAGCSLYDGGPKVYFNQHSPG